MPPTTRAPAGSATATPRPAPPAERARRQALARLGEIYVENGGLVLLWPFFARLLARLDLIDEARRFRSERAQIEAVVLLDYLAAEDPEPLEFRLGLAKILCGRPLAEACDLGGPLAPELQLEGEHLLASVRDHVPVLRDATSAALRADFLRRPAALSVEGGAWTLRVERRPHDRLLAHFPWAWTWVRLPWMSDPLRVEW